MRSNPDQAASYDGLVRALLESHRSTEAYEAADAALQQAPGAAAARAANGRALFRKGEIFKAEKAWRDALAVDPKSVSAMEGLARINSLLARFKTAQQLIGIAHRLAPDDPKLLTAFANGLHGPEQIAALRKALAMYDPEASEAKTLRARISSAEAVGDTKLRTLKSGYQQYRLKLMDLLDGPHLLRGFGLRVSFNGQRPATLLLDTGASGISLVPRLAEKYELRQTGDQAAEVRGIGNDEGRTSLKFLAASIRVGDLEFENYPVSVFDTAKESNADGMIGADVFARFLVTLDFPNRALTLEPFVKPPPEEGDGPEDAALRPQGLASIYRWRAELFVPTLVNTDTATHFFILDSGSSSNLIDSSVARNSTRTYRDEHARVKGVQGSVKEVSRAQEATLIFAGFRQQNPELVAVDLTKISDDMGVAIGGILGLNVLRNLKVTIDYRDAGVRFEYTPR